MSYYLPIIISAIIVFIALMWWLLSLGNVKKGATPPNDVAPPKAVPAPPVAATPPPVAPKATEKVAAAQLMDDPKPASKTAPPKAQAPLKAAATKAAPTKVAAKAPAKAAAPAAKKGAAPKVATPKAAAPKVAVAKVAAPKAPAKAAAKPKVTAEPKAKAAPKVTAKAAAPKAAPKAKPAPKPKAVAKAVIPDNLELLKGVGPKLNTLLKSLGITSFDQVANWSPVDITEIDSKLGTFAGRIARDNWVDQAKLLVAGDVAGFEKKYGALGSEVAKG